MMRFFFDGKPHAYTTHLLQYKIMKMAFVFIMLTLIASSASSSSSSSSCVKFGCDATSSRLVNFQSQGGGGSAGGDKRVVVGPWTAKEVARPPSNNGPGGRGRSK